MDDSDAAKETGHTRVVSVSGDRQVIYLTTKFNVLNDVLSEPLTLCVTFLAIPLMNLCNRPPFIANRE